MPIITVASTKGGVGKSTVAANLATQLSKMQVPVALLDGDPQGSVTKWNNVREIMISQGENMPSIFVASAQGDSLLSLALDKSAQGYIVIIDSAGVDNTSTRSALLRTDYILTLSAHSALDLWEIDTLLKVVQNLERAQKRRIPTLLLFNKVSSNKHVKGVQEALDFLQESFITPSYIFESVMKDRIIYQHIFREGKGVVEYMPVNTEARQEIKNVTEELVEFIKVKNKLTVPA